MSVDTGTVRNGVNTEQMYATLNLITPDQRLYALSGNGTWPRNSSKIAAATYAR